MTRKAQADEAAKCVDVNPESLTVEDYRHMIRDFENGILWAADGWQLILESAVQRLRHDVRKRGSTQLARGIRKDGKR